MRKKPLHPKPWFTSGTFALFESLTPEDIAAQMVYAANTGDEDAKKWITKFAGVPKTKAPLEELIDVCTDVRLVMSPNIGPGRTLKWHYGYLPSEGDGDIRALAMARVIQAGLLPRIKHCSLKECRKLFFGDIRARWCSPTCGSKHRVRIKRKKDKQRQML